MNRMKPILFNTEMVIAILDGRKTQTRRVVKPKHKNRELWEPIHHIQCPELTDSYGTKYKPKYQTDEILWVRETWGKKDGHYFYKAGHELLIDSEPLIKRWRPSIFMPREAARIFLRVTNVRVERLQDISVQDAKDEGIRVHANGCIDGLAYGCYNGDDCVNNICQQPIKYFHDLWDSLNAKRGYGWDTNPWVWVIEFERAEIIVWRSNEKEGSE